MNDESFFFEDENRCMSCEVFYTPDSIENDSGVCYHCTKNIHRKKKTVDKDIKSALDLDC